MLLELGVMAGLGYGAYQLCCTAKPATKTNKPTNRRPERAKKFRSALQKALAEFNIVDSSAFMECDKSHDKFFDALQAYCLANRVRLQLLGIQFEEIQKIKKQHSFHHPKSRRARCAMKRIEQLQCAGVLEIAQMRLEPPRSAYADPAILRALLAMSDKGLRCCLIANDRELRIRIREISRKSVTAVGTVDLAPLAASYLSTPKLHRNAEPCKKQDLRRASAFQPASAKRTTKRLARVSAVV